VSDVTTVGDRLSWYSFTLDNGQQFEVTVQEVESPAGDIQRITKPYNLIDVPEAASE